MSKPNILFIMADQFRADALGCTGGWVNTPNLDKIAKGGVVFENCVTTSPLCIPSRVSLAVGRYPHNTGVWTNYTYTLSPDTPTWYKAIREAGYRTSLFGKTHLHPHNGDLRDREHLLHSYGFDDVNEIAGPQASTRSMSYMTAIWQDKGELDIYIEDFKKRNGAPALYAAPSTLPLEDYTDVYVGQQAKQYLENYGDDKPWFCHVSFGGPHEPWDAPEPYASMYDPKTMPEPLKRYGTVSPDCPSGNIDKLYKKEKFKVSPDETQKLRANYAGNVTLIDEQIGEILSVIEKRGELENTVIVFTSDHGEMNGDHELFHKRSFLRSAVNIPLIIRTPYTLLSADANDKMRISSAFAELMDVGPTLVEIAGAKLNHEQFAQSLCPVLENKADSIHNEAISELSGEIMLENRKWKIVLNDQSEPYLLFDKENDPNEEVNLAGLPETVAIESELKLKILEKLSKTQVYRIESKNY